MLLMAQLTQGIIDAAIEGFESQKRRIDEQIAELRALSNGNAPAVAVARNEILTSAYGREAVTALMAGLAVEKLHQETVSY